MSDADIPASGQWLIRVSIPYFSPRIHLRAIPQIHLRAIPQRTLLVKSR
jgi:hypothetical protein